MPPTSQWGPGKNVFMLPPKTQMGTLSTPDPTVPIRLRFYSLPVPPLSPHRQSRAQTRPQRIGHLIPVLSWIMTFKTTGLGKGRGLYTTLQEGQVWQPMRDPGQQYFLAGTENMCLLITLPGTWNSPLGRKGEAWEAEKRQHHRPNQD